MAAHQSAIALPLPLYGMLVSLMSALRANIWLRHARRAGHEP